MTSNVKAGFHVSKSDGLVKNIQYLVSIGGRAVQCYLSPKQGAHPGIPVSEADVQTVLKLRTDLGLYMVVHGKLILNFARPNSQKTAWQQKAMVTDLTQAARFKADVIIHQAKNVKDKDLNITREQALDNFVQNIVEILDQTAKLGLTNKIILENSCQQGTELGYTLDELAKIYHKFTPTHQARIGFCLDLCHIYVAGTLNLADPVEVTKFFQEFDQKIGLNKLDVIHFNDSEIKFNGHNDSHADILIGYCGNPNIPGGNPAGFQQIVKLASQYDIPMILETPATHISYEDQLNLILDWTTFNQQNYVATHALKILEFAQNPVSRKGRKKKEPRQKQSKLQPKQQTLQPMIKIRPKTDTTTKTMALTSQDKIKITPKIKPKITLIKKLE